MNLPTFFNNKLGSMWDTWICPQELFNLLVNPAENWFWKKAQILLGVVIFQNTFFQLKKLWMALFVIITYKLKSDITRENLSLQIWKRWNEKNCYELYLTQALQQHNKSRISCIIRRGHKKPICIQWTSKYGKPLAFADKHQFSKSILPVDIFIVLK